jgi:hypothetical protein
MDLKVNPEGCEFCNGTQNVGICKGHRFTGKPCTNRVCEDCSPKVIGFTRVCPECRVKSVAKAV